MRRESAQIQQPHRQAERPAGSHGGAVVAQRAAARQRGARGTVVLVSRARRALGVLVLAVVAFAAFTAGSAARAQPSVSRAAGFAAGTESATRLPPTVAADERAVLEAVPRAGEADGTVTWFVVAALVWPVVGLPPLRRLGRRVDATLSSPAGSLFAAFRGRAPPIWLS
jgi:hypothetical protein